MTTFRAYLIENGLLHLEGEALAKARKDFKREYSRIYMRDFRKANKRIELFFTTDEYQLLHKKASIFELSKSAFCKGIVASELLQTPLKVNATEIENLQLEIRKIGNLVNQVVRKINMTRQVYPNDIRALNQRLHDLETLIELRLTHPNLFRENVIENLESKNSNVSPTS